MELIQKNPFRIIGLLSNTTVRDVQSRKGLITKYLSIGRQLESDFDFLFLNEVRRTEIVISRAFSKNRCSTCVMRLYKNNRGIFDQRFTELIKYHN